MSLLDINPEGQLDREIEDIVEELDIMLHLANTHKNILQKFVEQAEHILDPEGEFKGKNGPKRRRTADADLSLTDAEKERKKERERAYQCFKQKANEGQGRALDYITELENLRSSAKKTAEDVRKQSNAHTIWRRVTNLYRSYTWYQ